MDKYEMLEVVGEGSYGVVIKCKHYESGQFVAIKRFLETEEDHRVRKMAFREIRMLKKLHHENLVNMIEVFRQRKRFYLVFEYLDHTLLEEMEGAGNGLGWEVSKQHVCQVLRGLDFCHNNNIMHRDIKPENILVSPNGVIKLCDFGFARFVNSPNESCTDYVATRWYRAPELLVGDPRYGKAVDVWAVGCLFAEMMIGDPLFPGESDVDQLYRITKLLGGLCTKHQVIMGRSRPGRMLRHASADELVGPPKPGVTSIRKLFPTWDLLTIDFLAQCLHMDPDLRPKCQTLLHHPFFTQNKFLDTFLIQLEKTLIEESILNPLMNKKLREKNSKAEKENPVESEIKLFTNSELRWNMHLTKDAAIQPIVKLDSIKSDENQRVPSMIPAVRIRKLCYFDPISCIPYKNLPFVM
ncbi:cyclin-dependent kinase-like 4 [Ceratina calcarata]|uniref:cyclin-dependent kinase n=1 Tax=Ceratina calcarata TaxID=156304 RepID=A0AAJ7J4G0_9HYME|nr:cyclin-dependent kinase-like 4 [Ceratina calcarata]